MPGIKQGSFCGETVTVNRDINGARNMLNVFAGMHGGVPAGGYWPFNRAHTDPPPPNLRVGPKFDYEACRDSKGHGFMMRKLRPPAAAAAATTTTVPVAAAPGTTPASLGAGASTT